MNGERPFFDSNVLIYAFKEDDVRSDLAEARFAGGGVVGVQTLNEFTAVAVRKLRMLWRQIHQALADIKRLCPDAVPVSMTVHEAGIKIAERYGYRVYDSLMIAAALEASCVTLYSEDLQDGQVIEGLTIRNPFRVC